jgi:ABC-type uncharacterized transport system permease subunit
MLPDYILYFLSGIGGFVAGLAGAVLIYGLIRYFRPS